MILTFSGVKEYCLWETFNASCPEGHVIIMTSARYGRMKLGRCLSTDYYVGCEADVRDRVDARCSGRQNCSIKIPDPDLFKVQTCRRDLNAYLEASYECMQGRYQVVIFLHCSHLFSPL